MSEKKTNTPTLERKKTIDKQTEKKICEKTLDNSKKVPHFIVYNSSSYEQQTEPSNAKKSPAEGAKQHYQGQWPIKTKKSLTEEGRQLNQVSQYSKVEAEKSSAEKGRQLNQVSQYSKVGAKKSSAEEGRQLKNN